MGIPRLVGQRSASQKKKNGQIHIYIDFRDLNKACPKDDFPSLI